ncbi:50S ribosomal protein L1 [Candidatus Micrarchaeota archaeon]|nr:50S ribosomal protein L1 [Candidatus Micrarchaeota archaeon]
MIADKSKIENALEEALKEGKGKRKFTQSIDLAINFKDVDFKKPENRFNVDIVLPHQMKETKVAVFADGTLAFEAKKVADLVISGEEIPAFAADKKKQKELLKYSLLAAPQLMAVVGKQLGQLLGSRGKLPKPILPGSNLADLINRTKKTISLRVKGKNLPCVHCSIGIETMEKEQLVENTAIVLEAVEKSISSSQVKSVYVKTTMGKAARIV